MIFLKVTYWLCTNCAEGNSGPQKANKPSGQNGIEPVGGSTDKPKGQGLSQLRADKKRRKVIKYRSNQHKSARNLEIILNSC